MNVGGLLLLQRMGAPCPLGLRIFTVGEIDWSYLDELADQSPNGLSVYACDITMKVTDGSNDLRYPKFPAMHELGKHKARKAVNELNGCMDRMGVPKGRRGVIVYGSMSDRDTAYSIVGLRRVSREGWYWGHGELVLEVIDRLRPSWDWQPMLRVHFPIIWGRILLTQPTLPAAKEGAMSTDPRIRNVLSVLRWISRCFIIRGTTKFQPTTEFGFEMAVFTIDYQRRAGISEPFWFYDFYHIACS